MLILTMSNELWDEKAEEFIYTNEKTLKFEHSLLSVSKWEAIFNKPFLDTKEKTNDEIIEYIKCMSIGKELDDEEISKFTLEHFAKIRDYINSPMTATWFNENGPKRPNREIITSELIYYWMIAYHIPFECQKWHLNRLITLIRICGIKEQIQNGKNKMSKHSVMKSNQALNAQRRAKLKSRG